MDIENSKGETFIESLRNLENKRTIERFEKKFPEWVDEICGVVAKNKRFERLKPIVQLLVNAYHEEKGGIDPIKVRNFNTLKVFISISGASENHSGENEGLNILEEGMRLAQQKK